MGKSSGTNTTTSTSAPPADVMAQYDALIKKANAQADQPLQQYQGNIVAPINATQNQAATNVSNAQGIVTPYLNQAQGLIQQGSQTLNPNTVTSSDINNYQNPYTQDVINSTLANINQQNAGQQSALAGNAISQGAWGGDRSAVAQALLANQQDLAKNQTIAGLENQGYSQALAEANTQQQQKNQAQMASQAFQQQGGYGLANLGSEAQGAALTGANALNQIGNQQQAQTQAELNVPYEQFLQRQAYPFQNLSWLSGISTGLGSGMGGTSTTSQPAPNSIFGFSRGGHIDGLIKRLATGGAVLMPGDYNDGGPIKHLAWGGDAGNNSSFGVIPGQMNVGTIGSGIPDVSTSYIPGSTSLTKGVGIPSAPKPEQQTSPLSQISQGLGVANGVSGLFGGGKGASSAVAPQVGGMANNPLGLTPGSNFTSSDLASIGSDFNAGTSAALPGASSYAASSAADATASFADASPGFFDSLFAMFNRGGRVPQKLSFGGNVLPDILSAVGDVAGSFFGDPMAGNQFTSTLSKIDGGATKPGFQPGDLFKNRGGLVKHYADGGGDDTDYLTQLTSSASTPIPNQSPIPDEPLSSGLIKDDSTLATPQPVNFTRGDESPGLINQPAAATPAAPINHVDYTPIPTPTFHDAAPINDVNPWLSVAAGVAGALSGRSPYILQNLAGGLASGLTNYGQQKKEAAEETYKTASVQDARDKFISDIDQHNIENKRLAASTNANIENQMAERQNQSAQLAETSKYHQAEIAHQNALVDLQKKQFEQGKISVNPITGQRYYTMGANAGQIVPDQEKGSTVDTFSQNIGVPLNTYTSKEDAKKSASMISTSTDNLGPLNDSIMSIHRIQELLPKIDQGKMEQALRYGERVLGEGTPERAAYEELQKLEGNAALQNEVSQGVKGRALGVQMVKLGQGLFANPEMTKEAQSNILNKADFVANMAKNSNEVIQPFEGHSTGTLNQVKQKYYNDSISAGYAIPTQDYLTGAWKKEGYRPAPQTKSTYIQPTNSPNNSAPDYSRLWSQ